MVAAPATLHVVEGDDSERDSLVALLSTAGYATHAYPSAAALLASAAAVGASDASGRGPSRPSAVVADMQILGADGLALLQRPRGMDGLPVALPVVLVTAHATVQQAVHAMKAGAVDFLEKPLDDAALFTAVEKALDRFRSAKAEFTTRAEARRRLQTLLPREREVLERLLVRGFNKAIASDLGLSPRTVELYRARIMAKTKAAGLPELVRLAIEAGMWGCGLAASDAPCIEVRQMLDINVREQEGLRGW